MKSFEFNLQTSSVYRPFKMDNITFHQGGLLNFENENNNLSSATNISFNISGEATIDEIDPILAVVFESPTLKILAFFAYILLIPIGCTLLFLMLHYEQFGGDPQKRSIFNQIVAFMAALEFIMTIITEHIFIVRLLFGCLPSGLGTFLWFITGFKHCVLGTLLVIATTYKTIGTFSFRRIAGLNDNFLSLFFLLATLMNCLIFMFVLYMLGLGDNHHLNVVLTCKRTEVSFFLQSNR